MAISSRYVSTQKTCASVVVFSLALNSSLDQELRAPIDTGITAIIVADL
jgi:hypothetical protein